MAHVRNFRKDDEARMKEIAPRAFGVWTRLALDKSIPKERAEKFFAREVSTYVNRALLKGKDFGIQIAEEDKEVVGYIVLGIDRDKSKLFGFTWGHIMSLAVDPAYHGGGIGSALIASGLDWLQKKGVEYVEVLTDQNNIAAIRAYENNDFRVIYSSLVLSQYLQ